MHFVRDDNTNKQSLTWKHNNKNLRAWFYFFGFVVGRTHIVGDNVLSSSKILCRWKQRCHSGAISSRPWSLIVRFGEGFLEGLHVWSPGRVPFWVLGVEFQGHRVLAGHQGEDPWLPQGLNLQHNIEDSHQEDVIFVPFFSSLSYNRYVKVASSMKVSTNKMLQDKLLLFLISQEEWKEV